MRKKNQLSFLVKAAFNRYFMAIGMSIIPFSSMRVLILRWCGVKVGKSCYVGFGVAFDTNYPVLISIGDSVTISHSCCLISHTKSPTGSWLSEIYNSSAPVTIESGAWLGAHSIVLPGVTIAADCFVAAGSVVTKSTSPRSLWAGNPCRLVTNIVS